MSYIYLMPYCIAKYCHAIVSYENNPSSAHFHMHLTASEVPTTCYAEQAGPCLQSILQERRLW